MARPSNKEERSNQILSAYERCIGKYGVEGTTLIQIAEEAGLSRALVRHHVGNQDDLLKQAISRFITREEQLYNAYPPEQYQTIDDFLGHLFIYEQDYITNTLIAQAFTSASFENTEIREPMIQWFNNFSSWLLMHLEHKFPDVEKDKLLTVSAGILSICVSYETTIPITDQSFRERSIASVKILVNSLND
ncbi:MAG TPA: hypothetical protein DE276_01500 [Oceanospirillaceae bacterium]|nr:hypothetical protein [Oceanospirillaceae bacterium]|tara:strand:- start:582 stop:1154 length:573 start_codon:yes stop_codon:yes gene_type:complete